MSRFRYRELVRQLTGVFNTFDPIGVGSSLAYLQDEYRNQVYQVLRLLPSIKSVEELEIELAKLIKTDFGISARTDMLKNLSAGLWEVWQNPRDADWHPPARGGHQAT